MFHAHETFREKAVPIAPIRRTREPTNTATAVAINGYV